MVKCSMCTKQLPDKLTFAPSGNIYYLQDANNIQKPFMLIQYQNNAQYEVMCSEKCSVGKILLINSIKSHMKEKFNLIFKISQISDGIIEQFSALNQLLQQENTLTEAVYKKQNNTNLIEEFRIQISKSIQPIVFNLTNQLISHLDEAIKFSMSETEKINAFKQQLEKLLNEYGNTDLLNNKGYINLCKEDIKNTRLMK
ncbi:hypothetical protein pb186bvf_000352 [Paramecium bursaria]